MSLLINFVKFIFFIYFQYHFLLMKNIMKKIKKKNIKRLRVWLRCKLAQKSKIGLLIVSLKCQHYLLSFLFQLDTSDHWFLWCYSNQMHSCWIFLDWMSISLQTYHIFMFILHMNNRPFVLSSKPLCIPCFI